MTETDKALVRKAITDASTEGLIRLDNLEKLSEFFINYFNHHGFSTGSILPAVPKVANHKALPEVLEMVMGKFMDAPLEDQNKFIKELVVRASESREKRVRAMEDEIHFILKMRNRLPVLQVEEED